MCARHGIQSADVGVGGVWLVASSGVPVCSRALVTGMTKVVFLSFFRMFVEALARLGGHHHCSEKVKKTVQNSHIWPTLLAQAK